MARFFDKGKYKHSFIVFTFKYAPLVCAFMGAAFVLALICCNQIVRLFSLSASAGLFLVQMLAVIAIMIGFGFYRSLALRRNFSMLKTCLSFVLGFAFSLALSLVIFAAGMFAYFNSFQYVKIHPDYSFQMRLKPLFAMCPEYDRSIVFASGKTVSFTYDANENIQTVESSDKLKSTLTYSDIYKLNKITNASTVSGIEHGKALASATAKISETTFTFSPTFTTIEDD